MTGRPTFAERHRHSIADIELLISTKFAGFARKGIKPVGIERCVAAKKVKEPGCCVAVLIEQVEVNESGQLRSDWAMSAKDETVVTGGAGGDCESAGAARLGEAA